MRADGAGMPQRGQAEESRRHGTWVRGGIPAPWRSLGGVTGTDVAERLRSLSFLFRDGIAFQGFVFYTGE